MNYQTFLKHAQKVTKTASSSRPTLKGVHHLSTHVVATDSHRLMRADYTMKDLEGKIVDPKTGNTIEGNYPDTSRLVPSLDDARITFDLDIPSTIQFLKAVKTLKIERVVFYNHPDKNKVHLRASNSLDTVNLSLDTMYGIHSTVDLEPTYCNTIYLLDALEWLKEYYSIVTVHWYGRLRPFCITPQNHIDNALALILPIRPH